MQCPCGSQSEFAKCCEPYLQGARKPDTAEQLMRSRYTAFTTADMEYVFNTHDPRTRKKVDFKSNKQWAEKSEWLGLEILKTEAGGPTDQTGIVEFIARYRAGGEDVAHHELSEFRRDQGAWVFVDGKDPEVRTFVRAEAKVGRNDPCLCGSGKKYKKCCGA